MQKEISNKELAAIGVVRSLLMKNGRMPSVRELMKELGYKSPRSASMILQSLEEKGILSKKADGGYQLNEKHTEVNSAGGEQTIKVPLLGKIACGPPIFAEENVEATFSVSVKLAKQPGRYFFLRAIGDSMNLAGINEGDLLLVRQQSTADDGDTVVALIDDEATVKKIKINADHVLLVPQSSNTSHLPIILARDFTVQGIVVSVIPGV